MSSFHDLVAKMGPMLGEDFDPRDPLAESKMMSAEDDDDTIVKACLAASAKVAEAMKLKAAGDTAGMKEAIKDAHKLMNSVKSLELGNHHGPKQFSSNPGELMQRLLMTVKVHAHDAGLTTKSLMGMNLGSW